MKWCMWCGKELKYVAGKGWLHPNGKLYETFVGPDGKERDHHCAFPTNDQTAVARVAFQRGEEEARERRENLSRKLESIRTERIGARERDATSIAGMFAEALGCLEDAVCYLEQVNERYDPELHDDDIRPYKSAMDFWLQAELAQESVKDVLNRLQRVEPLAPKGEMR